MVATPTESAVRAIDTSAASARAAAPSALRDRLRRFTSVSASAAWFSFESAVLIRRIVSSARCASSFAVSENCCSCDAPSAITGSRWPGGGRGIGGLSSFRFCSRIVARPVIRLRSTTARVLSLTGVAGSMPIPTSTVPGRCSANEKPVTAPTRMPFMRTSLRTCSPSSDWRVK